MDIESGEYFSITRGIRLNTTSLFSFSSTEVEHYDRSYEGLIFLAEEVCYPMVAAKLVYSPTKKQWIKVGDIIPVNLRELEIMTLTKKFVETVLSSALQKIEKK